VVVVMMTWQRGRRIVTARREKLEGPLTEFVEEMRSKPLPRVKGTAVFPHPNKETTPLALRANVQFNHVLHECVVIVSVVSENVPHIAPAERLAVDELGYADDGIVHLQMRFGFQDEQDIPEMLAAAVGLSPELEIETDETSYFLSRINLQRGPDRSMMRWRKRLFVGLAHNAANPAAYFCLPVDRTVVMASQVEL
jgi:KUP system potassium uptake protein